MSSSFFGGMQVHTAGLASSVLEGADHKTESENTTQGW